MSSDLDENFETTLEFLKAFALEKDDELEAIRDSISKDELLMGMLQVNLVLLSRLSDHEPGEPEELLAALSAVPPEPPRLRLL